jgi:hypothetical protein
MFDLFQMIAREVERQSAFSPHFIPFVRLFNDEPRYVEKIKQGIVFYVPRKQRHPSAFNKPVLYHRRITSLRVHTHQVK